MNGKSKQLSEFIGNCLLLSLFVFYLDDKHAQGIPWASSHEDGHPQFKQMYSEVKRR
jgi:hypothetical protein